MKRFELFANSYVGYKLSRYLRKKYGWDRAEGDIVDFWLDNFYEVSGQKSFVKGLKQKLDKDPDNYDFLRSYIAQCSAIQEDVTKGLRVLAEHLRIDHGTLESFISRGHRNLFTGEPRIVFQKSSYNQIYEEGYYIKVEPNTTETEVKKAHSWIKNLLESTEPECPVFKELPSRKPDEHDEHDVFYYTLIEKEMILIDKARAEGSTSDADDYGGSLVGQAIERVVGKILEVNEIEDDALFMKLEGEGYPKMKQLYYKITERYKLPTPKKLKSILEVISK